MEQKKLAGIKLSNIFYFLVIIVFLITVTVLFFYSTSFILRNINKIFSPDESHDTKILKLENYTLTAKKLNLATTTRESVSSVEMLPTEVSTSTLDKNTITIHILNGTEKAGLASILANALEEAGLSQTSIGNESKLHNQTTIIIRDSKKEYASLLEEVVKQSYSEAITQITTDSVEFDVTIIIGEN